ncbi:hypothetical protein DM02DRAFT_660621 [Periconia macrospinosa]|uniref:Rhodopsin domain-containing protein n=1 Tax=Periconia macrospinosa TaxID=97972 RepID=A0A2V1DBH9_9PLEO|nr:hypothetical protein DM02DRAFT_660621 [Periconia macrospinosa]
MAGFSQESSSLLICVLILAVAGFTSLGLRFYIRITRRAWGPDDWCTAYAAIPFMVQTISGVLAAYYGIGQRIAGLSPLDLKNALMWWNIFAFSYPNSMVPIKLGISFQLYRVAVARKGYLYAIYGIMISSFLTLLTGFIFQLIQCKPIQFNWDKTIPGGYCYDPIMYAIVSYVVCAINIATDCLCAFLPIPLLWNVRMSRRKKISVGVLLSMGALSCSAAIIRIKYTISLADTTDFTLNVVTLSCLAYAEPAIGYFAANLATLRPLLKIVLKERSTNDTNSLGLITVTGSRHDRSNFSQLRDVETEGMKSGNKNSRSFLEDQTPRVLEQGEVSASVNSPMSINKAKSH